MRVPTDAEWAHSTKWARRMRKLDVDASRYPITPGNIQILQLRAAADPWLPRLKSFVCVEATGEFIPFIPSFLSPKTTVINVEFAEDASVAVLASVISRLSTLCPSLNAITLDYLPRAPVITEAVSGMLLACNPDILETFNVDSSLTEEAREVVYRLPKLSHLWTLIQGSTSLPTVTLPNLFAIDVEYDDLDWLQGFHGATLEKLESVTFRTESNHTGDILKAFEDIALAASAQNTLAEFLFDTSRSWNPNYSALLSFKQLEHISIEFSCRGGCSSRVDDDIAISLARAMPKLEVLQLGTAPCKTPTGVTVKGLIALARFCPHLTKLCIHFRASTLVGAATSGAILSPSDEPGVLREECALTDLETGKTPIPAGSGLEVAQSLVQIFPRILNLKYKNHIWGIVASIIRDFSPSDYQRASKAHASHIFDGP